MNLVKVYPKWAILVSLPANKNFQSVNLPTVAGLEITNKKYELERCCCLFVEFVGVVC